MCVELLLGAIDVRTQIDASISLRKYIEEYCTTAQSFTLHAMFAWKVKFAVMLPCKRARGVCALESSSLDSVF